MTTTAKTTTPKTTTAKTADTHDAKVFTPAANPAAAVAGVLIGVALFGLAAVAIRDLLVELGWLSGDEWSRSAADWMVGIRWWDWMWPAAIAFIIVGVGLLWLAVRPRRRTHLSLSGYEVMWTRRGDIARRCSAAVSTLSGIRHASTVVGRRTVTVSVTTREPVDRASVDAEVERVVGAVLSGIDAPLRARVKIVRDRSGDRS